MRKVSSEKSEVTDTNSWPSRLKNDEEATMFSPCGMYFICALCVSRINMRKAFSDRGRWKDHKSSSTHQLLREKGAKEKKAVEDGNRPGKKAKEASMMSFFARQKKSAPAAAQKSLLTKETAIVAKKLVHCEGCFPDFRSKSMSKYLSSFGKYAAVCRNSAYRIQSVAGYSQVFTKDCDNHRLHHPGKLGGLRCTKCEKYWRAEGDKAKQVIKSRKFRPYVPE